MENVMPQGRTIIWRGDSRFARAVFLISDRERIRDGVELGERVPIFREELKDRDEGSGSAWVAGTVVKKYPYFMRLVDARGFSYSMDYFEYEMAKRKRTLKSAGLYQDDNGCSL